MLVETDLVGSIRVSGRWRYQRMVGLLGAIWERGSKWREGASVKVIGTNTPSCCMMAPLERSLARKQQRIVER